jgi:large-conductance mechanosensitive channel
MLEGFSRSPKSTTIAQGSQRDGSFHHQLRHLPSSLFDFIIIAFVTFMAMKQVTRFEKEAPLLRRNFPRCDDKKTHTIDAPHN